VAEGWVCIPFGVQYSPYSIYRKENKRKRKRKTEKEKKRKNDG